MVAKGDEISRRRENIVKLAQEMFARFESINDLSKYKDPIKAKSLKDFTVSLLYPKLKEGKVSYAELDPTGKRDGAEIKYVFHDYLYNNEIEKAQRNFRGYAHKTQIIHSGGRDLEFWNAASSLGGVDSSLKRAKEYFPSRDSQYTALKLTAYDLRQMENRLVALGENELKNEANNDWRKDGVKRYKKFMDQLPGFPGGNGQELEERLFQPDRSGYSPLDNPRIWQDGRAARWLMENLPLDDKLLSRRTGNGGSLLLAAFNGMPAEEVMGRINKQGNQLDKSMLLKADGTPNFIMQVLMYEGKSDALFTRDNWLGKRDEMTEVYNAMPEDRRPPNYHRLRQELKGVESTGIGR